MSMYKPNIGDNVEDTASRGVGRVMGFEGPFVRLRPIGGGREWDAGPGNLRLLTVHEALSKGAAAANARSRGERP